MTCTINFPASWIDASKFERTLQRDGAPHDHDGTVFKFPAGSKIMLDTAIRLLSLCNQLVTCSHRVVLDFEEDGSGALGYLDRMGFFDHLDSRVDVLPDRPIISGAEIYRGTNQNLVEIMPINPRERQQDLPAKLTAALMNGYTGDDVDEQLEGASLTIFKELVDNVFSHSQTPLDGYAALQTYKGGSSLKVAVSDSGLGILETLRPALRTVAPSKGNLTDTDLIVEIFRQGLSRHGSDRGCGLRGCGLRGCASKAIKFGAELDVRLPKSRVKLTPAREGYRPNTAYCYNDLPLIWGTHICFTFDLDK
jgi:hypothetical protein